MKYIKLLIILSLSASSAHALAQNDTDRCWMPNNSQIKTMQIFKEARKKAIQGDEILKEVNISETQRQDPDFIRAAMECSVLSLYKENIFLSKNKEFALTLVEQGSWYDGHLDESLLKDWDVALTAVKYDNFAPRNLPKNLRANRDFILTALRESPDSHNWDIYKVMDDKLKKDRKIVLLAVKSHGELLIEADERFWKDKEIVLAAVKSTKASFNRLAQEDKRYRNYDVLKHLSANNGVDKSLFTDPDVIEAANTKEIEILPFQESCPNHCSEYK